jgi:hypothetical protein
VLALALRDALQNKVAHEERIAKAAIEAQEAEIARAAIAAQEAATRAQELATKQAQEAQEAQEAKEARQAQRAKNKLQLEDARSVCEALLSQPPTYDDKCMAKDHALCHVVIRQLKLVTHMADDVETLLDNVYLRACKYTQREKKADKAKQAAAGHDQVQKQLHPKEVSEKAKEAHEAKTAKEANANKMVLETGWRNQGWTCSKCGHDDNKWHVQHCYICNKSWKGKP